MRICKDFYFYPWMSPQDNNANTIFIDGQVPTLIDPGHSHLFGNIAESMLRDRIDVGSVKLLLFTHGHPDHVEAADRFDDAVLRGIGKAEYRYMHEEGKDLFLGTGVHLPSKPFQILLDEGELRLGSKTFLVIPTPGHSPGSICLYYQKEKVLISGDTVFYLGMGRTDLPGGDTARLAESIGRLAKLHIEYLIPGHGDMVRGRKAIEKNFQMILSEFF